MLIVASGSKKSKEIMPTASQKKVHITVLAKSCDLNFLLWENASDVIPLTVA